MRLPVMFLVAHVVNLLDPTCERIRCVVDINPRKQGQFVPGTGHPIIPPDRLIDLDVKTIVVLNPAYVSEIKSWLVEHNLSIGVVDLMGGGH